jgi:hypothetical protein
VKTPFQYSIRALFGLAVVLALCLAVASFDWRLPLLAMVAYFAAVLCVVWTEPLKRALVWGPLLGMCVFLAAGVIMAGVMGERAFTSYRESRPYEAFVRQYAVPLGGFVGGVVGIVIASIAGSRQQRDK